MSYERERRKRRKNTIKIKLMAVLALISAAACTAALGEVSITSESVPAEAQFYELARVSLQSRESIAPPPVDMGSLKDLGTLRNKYYSVDKKTGMTKEMFDIDRLMAEDIHINADMSQPKVLIFHTHAHEMYADSKSGEGVIGAGELLKQTLETEYGVKCLHVTESFDTVDGKLQILGAYERMEPRIRQILKENPSIEMAIDLHRDGVGENVRLVSEADGERCAKFMFFNGLCKKADSDGILRQADGLENPYVEQNLALSLKAQMCANKLYPGLTRKIYLNAYRYSLHMLPKSMLIELGAQTNTEQEVKNSVKKLARVLYETVFNRQN